MTTEATIRTAAKMYEMRDTAKRLLGDKYHERMTEFGRVLQQTADRDKEDVIAVATKVCSRAKADEMVVLMVMAAAVELMEPSK